MQMFAGKAREMLAVTAQKKNPRMNPWAFVGESNCRRNLP
jgi:hypothetical protein